MHMFKNAQMFELINEVDKLLIPILEARRDFKKLQMLHQRLGEAYGKILTTVSEIFQFFYLREILFELFIYQQFELGYKLSRVHYK